MNNSLPVRDSDSKSIHPLIWILFIGAVVRLGFWSAWTDVPVRITDAQDYNQLAIGLVKTGNYVNERGDLVSLRPPIYPVFVAGIYRVFGVENYAAVRAVQNLISLFTVVCCYFLAQILYDKKVATWAAAGVCFYPSLIGFNNILLSETLFTFLVSAVSLSTVMAVRNHSYRWLVVTAILMGLGALVRSILWLFSPFLSLFIFIAWGSSLRKRTLAAVTPFVLFLLILSPWIYRNTKLHKTFTVIDVMGGRNAMMGNYEYTPLERNWATISIVEGEERWFRVLSKKTPNYKELTQGQIDKVAMKHGIQFVLANPILTAKRDVIRFFNFWQLERTLVAGGLKGTFGEIPKVVLLPLAALICGYYVIVFFSGIFGAIFFPCEDRLSYWFLIFSILFPCAIHTLIFAHSRYHLPIMPLVTIFAAAALVNRKELISSKSRSSIMGVLFVCLIFVLSWLRELIFVDLHQFQGMVG